MVKAYLKYVVLLCILSTEVTNDEKTTPTPSLATIAANASTATPVTPSLPSIAGNASTTIPVTPSLASTAANEFTVPVTPSLGSTTANSSTTTPVTPTAANSATTTPVTPIPTPVTPTTTPVTPTTTPVTPTTANSSTTTPLPSTTTTGSAASDETTFPPASTSAPEVCLSDYNSTSNILWPSTSSKTASQPLCVNSAKELAYRECVNGIWATEPKCASIQSERLPLCPENFTENSDFCYIFTPKSVFPPSCPFPDVLPFDSFIDVIDISDPVWLPVTRDLRNGLGFLQWIEASSLYQTEFENYSYERDNSLNKDCVVVNSTKKSTAVSCKEEYRGVCAYNNLNTTSNKACSEYRSFCRQSDYYSKKICFCFDDTGVMQGHKAELVELYQNSIFLTNEICNIGLVKDQQGKYIWSSSTQDISYTYWSREVDFDTDNLYGAATPNGWILASELANCSIIETTLVPLLPSLSLFYDFYLNQLTLIVSNPSWLQSLDDSEPAIFCFTDVALYLPIYQYPELHLSISEQYKMEYTFQPIVSFPGLYWCEAFTFLDLEIISTQPYLHLTTPHYFEFVGLFQIEIPSLDIDPLSSQILPFLNDTLLDPLYGLTNNETVYVVRLMKIVDLDETSNLIFVNLHFSSYILLDDASDAKKEFLFYNLQTMITEKLDQGDDTIEMVKFHSADFCTSETITYDSGVTLTWPTTSSNTETSSNEFCFRDDGNLSTNVCGGNFSDGFSWMYPFVECTILPQSSISQKLIPLYHQYVIVDEDMKTLLQIEPKKASALDVYLLAEIYKKYFTATDNLTVDIFTESIQIIFRIDPGVLSQSQLITRATDRILHVIDTVLETCQSSFQVVTSHFAFFLLLPSAVTGLVTKIIDGAPSVNILTGDWDPDRLVQEVEDLELAIWLSPALKDQISNESLVAFTFYFNDVLFRESPDTRNVSTVFGTALRNTGPNLVQGPVSVIQKFNFANIQSASCASWIYDVAYLRGFWMEDKQSNNISSYLVCDFWHVANFAIVATIDDDYNVTAGLEDLLGDSIADSDKIIQLVTITEKHQHFKPIDLFLLGQVLDLVRDNTNNDLTCLGDVVDNLHRIERTVLTESQQQHKATDLILSGIDMIIKNYDNNDDEVLITTDNFLVFVTQDADFIGLILQDESAFKVATVSGDFEVEDLQFYDFSSSILLSPALRKQIPEGSKIVITVFYSDVLFNEKQASNKTVSKVFGVILPDIGKYSGPVSIIHNMSSVNYLTECSHWNYSTKQVVSYWQKDTSAITESVIIECDFWHTTHFALLLVNDDSHNDPVLEWITVINSSISLLGLCLILLTAVLFKKWRRNIGNQILLNFSLAIILQLVTLFVAGSVRRDFDYVCTCIGAFLHYTVISQFCWMLTVAVIQFRRFVTVLATSSRFILLKACLCAWILPLVLVIATLVVDRETYIEGRGGICYPSGLAMYLAVWLPIVLITSINVIIFIYIMYSVIRTKVDTVVGSKDDAKHQWRLFVLLFFMLGLTWCFGFMSGLGFGIVFVYLFSFTATLQGFVLFLYFILFNTNTRHLYVQGVRRYILRKNCRINQK